MNTQNYRVLKAVSGYLEQGMPIYLATVIETWGASPRPVGSLLGYCPLNGLVVGSLSGGCVEDDLLRELASEESVRGLKFPLLREYGSDRRGMDLPCGATLRLCIERIESCETSIQHFQQLLNAIDAQLLVARSVSLAEVEGDGFARLEFEPGKPEQVLSLHKKILRHYFQAPDKLLLIGASDVTAYLLPLAESLGFETTVCEPRSDVLQRQTMLNNSWIVVSDRLPDDLVHEQFMHARCAVIALAHDPRIDDLALIAALAGEAFFVGAMGSEKTSQARRVRLKELGVSNEQLQRLSAPVGKEIFSRTPAEIAISIAAELVEARALSNSRCLSSNNFNPQALNVDTASN